MTVRSAESASLSAALPNGIEHIRTVEFSNVTSVALDNVFSDKYLQYRLVMGEKLVSGSATNPALRFRTGGSTISNSIYKFAYWYANGTAVSAYSANGSSKETYWGWIGDVLRTPHRSHTFLEIKYPYQSRYTIGCNTRIYNQGADMDYEVSSWGVDSTASYDGFELCTENGSSTISGFASLYGFVRK